MNKPLVTDEEYKIEAHAQREWLNWVFAVVTFSLCIECLQFPQPHRVALLGLILIVPMYAYAIFNIPRPLRALRRLRDEGIEDPLQQQEVMALIMHFESKFHGLKTALFHISLWLSLCLYCIILLSFDERFQFIFWFKA